jgi:hypothetical protein
MIRMAWCCLVWKNVSAIEFGPGGNAQPTAPDICRTNPSVALDASRIDVTIRKAGNSVRIDEYAAALAMENWPWRKACQNARRNRVKCIGLLRLKGSTLVSKHRCWLKGCQKPTLPHPPAVGSEPRKPLEVVQPACESGLQSFEQAGHSSSPFQILRLHQPR